MSTPPPFPLTARARRGSLAAMLLGAGLLLAGCSQPGQVKNYNDTVKANFVDKCVEANGAKDPDPKSTCECWYANITKKFTFGDFKSLDNALRDGVSSKKITSTDDLKNNPDPRIRDFYAILTDPAQQDPKCTAAQGPAAAPTTTTSTPTAK